MPFLQISTKLSLFMIKDTPKFSWILKLCQDIVGVTLILTELSKNVELGAEKLGTKTSTSLFYSLNLSDAWAPTQIPSSLVGLLRQKGFKRHDLITGIKKALRK